MEMMFYNIAKVARVNGKHKTSHIFKDVFHTTENNYTNMKVINEGVVRIIIFWMY